MLRQHVDVVLEEEVAGMRRIAADFEQLHEGNTLLPSRRMWSNLCAAEDMKGWRAYLARP